MADHTDNPLTLIRNAGAALSKAYKLVQEGKLTEAISHTAAAESFVIRAEDAIVDMRDGKRVTCSACNGCGETRAKAKKQPKRSKRA